jgi:UDP-N-acetylmuramate dehydrogenase
LTALPEAWQPPLGTSSPATIDAAVSNMGVGMAELRQLQAALKGRLCIDEPMSRHTSFRIGGKADLFLHASCLDDLRVIFTWAAEKHLPLKVIGNGSNMLVSDRGIRGVVVRLTSGFSEMHFSPEGLLVGAGAKLARLIDASARECYTGLESMVGIPGTLGGALATNAGTDTGSIGDLVVEVSALEENGETAIYPRSQLVYRYRWSSLSGRKLIILGAKLALSPSTTEQIRAKIERLLEKRAARQPIHDRSAGSIFKNPEAIAAGKLLDRAGAKGMRVGDAEVSLTHANFIINRGHAAAADIRTLIEKCHQLVLEVHGVDLEREVEMVGEW